MAFVAHYFAEKFLFAVYRDLNFILIFLLIGSELHE